MQDPRYNDEALELEPQLRTFLFADIRGYTRFTQERGNEAAARLATRLAVVAREQVEARGGKVLELQGDQVMAVFSSARPALWAAVELQERYARETRDDPALPMHVGMGVEAGEVIPVEGGFRGGVLNLAARLCSLAGTGEVLTSEGLIHVTGKIEGLTFEERGLATLKGFAAPVRIVEVLRATPELSDEVLQPDRAPTREERLPIGGYLGALPEGELVARDVELERAVDAVDAVVAGEGRLVVLAGEPGVGKTRLAQEVALTVRNRQFLLATGRCYETEHAVPFYPFLEALSTAYAAASAGIRAQASRRWPLLARLLPEQMGTSPATHAGEEEQQRLFWAVTGLLQAMAEETPVALFLDDVHWADESSIRLIQHLARHTRGHRVLLLLTYRDVEVTPQHPLERAILDLTREQLITRIPLSRLSQEGTAALMAARLGEADVAGDFAALVYRHTDGNPFFVQEVLRELIDRGEVYLDRGRWRGRDVVEIDVPETVRALIRQRLSRLSLPSQDILHEASVLGQSFLFDDLQDMQGRLEDEVEAVLQEAVTSGLLRTAPRDRYTFNHALTQQAVYSEIPPRRRRRLHLAAGEALDRQPAMVRDRRATELVRHFLQGGDERRALPCMLLAGDQAEAVFAHPEAEAHYRMALVLARRLEDRVREREALEKLGGVLRIVARYDEALELLEEAAGMSRASGDLVEEARAVAQIGFIHHLRGTAPEGIERIQPVLRALDEKPIGPAVSHAIALLLLPLAHLYYVMGNIQDSLTTAQRAGDLARLTNDERILAEAEALRGLSLWLAGDQEAALDVLEGAIVLADRVHDNDSLFLALDAAGEIQVTRGELAASREKRMRAAELISLTGDPAKTGFEVACVGYVYFCLGDWKEARSQCERALDLTSPLGPTWFNAHSLLRLGMLDLAEGKEESAERLLDEGVRAAEAADNPGVLAVGVALRAELDLLRGRPEEARSRLEEALAGREIAETETVPLLSRLAEAYLLLGKETDAEILSTRAIQSARQQRNYLALADALLVQGMVFCAQRRWDDAQQTLEHGLTLVRSMPFPYAEARLLYHYGSMQAEREEPREAENYLQEARAIFERLGARMEGERAARALACC